MTAGLSPDPLFVGVDGGGTGCRARIEDSTGRVLGTGIAGPASCAPMKNVSEVSLIAVPFMSASFDIGGTASRPCQPFIGDGIPPRALRSPDCENERERLPRPEEEKGRL